MIVGKEEGKTKGIRDWKELEKRERRRGWRMEGKGKESGEEGEGEGGGGRKKNKSTGCQTFDRVGDLPLIWLFMHSKTTLFTSA